MAGLLIKDYVSSCRVRKINILWILIFFTIVSAIFRMFFPGALTEEDQLTCISDKIFVTIFLIFVVLCLVLSNIISYKVITHDEKAHCMLYLNSMPVRKNSYVGSKYVFMLIVCSVLMILESIWGRACCNYCAPGLMTSACKTLISAITTFASVAIILAAFDIPLYLFWGKEKAILIKSIFIMLLAVFAALYFLTHRVPSIRERFELTYILNWYIQYHSEVKFVRNTLPFVALVIYGISFLSSCRRMNRMKHEL